MKKFLSLIALLIATVAAYAGETVVFKASATVTSAGKTTEYPTEEVSLEKLDNGTYTVVYKKLAPMAYKRFGDFKIENVNAQTDASGVTTFSTEEVEGTWQNIQSSAIIGGVTEGAKASLNSFSATLSADKQTLTLEFVMVSNGTDVEVLFNKTTESVNGINADADKVVQIYTLGGMLTNHLQRGVNIVRTADGKVKKILVK